MCSLNILNELENFIKPSNNDRKSFCVSLSGHVNFSDEVTSSIRISDGVVLFIDAAEGVSNLLLIFYVLPIPHFFCT